MQYIYSCKTNKDCVKSKHKYDKILKIWRAKNLWQPCRRGTHNTRLDTGTPCHPPPPKRSHSSSNITLSSSPYVIRPITSDLYTGNTSSPYTC